MPVLMPMDERLRRAYLAAMDIPVWIPRGDEDPCDADAVGARPARDSDGAPGARSRPGAAPTGAAPAGAAPTSVEARAAQSTEPSPRRAQALLGETTAAAPRRPAPASERPVAVAARVSGQKLALLFARAGATLFLDELPAGNDNRVKELLEALAFVLEGQRLAPALQAFNWPPGRAAFDFGQACDAVRGRIAKLHSEAPLKRLVLLGEPTARLLLSEPRAGGLLRLEGLDCVVVPALAEMLARPERKRVAWQSLRLLRRG